MDNNQLIKKDGGLIQQVGNAISVTNKLLSLAEPQLIPYRKRDKWGFCTPDKKIVIDCIYDDVTSFKDGFAKIKKDQKDAIIDKANKIQIPFIYDNIDFPFIEKAYSIVYKNNYSGIGLIDKNAKELIPPSRYDYIWVLFNDDFFRVRKNNKEGFVNWRTGKEIVQCIYEAASPYYEDLAKVQLNKKWGYIDREGSNIIPFKFESAGTFSDGLARVTINNKNGYIDKLGDEVIKAVFGEAFAFSNGHALVRDKGKWGFIDRQGKLFASGRYDRISPFGKDGIARVELKGKFGFIDGNGFEVISPKYQSTCSSEFYEGFITVQRGDKFGFCGLNGHELTPCIYDEANRFFEGIAEVKLNEKFGFIDKNGNQLIPCVYDEVQTFSEGLLSAKYKKKVGFINKNGVTVISFLYEETEPFLNGLAKVKLNGKWGYINKEGVEYWED